MLFSIFLVIGIILGLVLGFFLGKFAQGMRAEHEKSKQLIEEVAEQIKQQTQGIRSQSQEDIKNAFHEALVYTGKQLSSNYGEQLNAILNPFKENISEFKQRVNDIHDKNTEQNRALYSKLMVMTEASQKLSEEANNLTNALKNRVKLQGSWGEQILKRVLDQSGLIKGVHYLEEASYREEKYDHLGLLQSQHKRPDFIIKLPDNRDIIVDAKLTLQSYVDYFNATEEQHKQLLLQEIKNNIKNHIKNLANKEYNKLTQLNTVQAVFMFVPIESLYILLVENFQDLFLEAARNNVYITSPSGLMPLLTIIDHTWQVSRQSENIQEMSQVAGKIYDNLTLIATAVDDVDGALNNASKKVGILKTKLRKDRGSAIQLAHKLKNLGAPTSKNFAANWQEAVDNEVENTVIDNDSNKLI